MLFKDFVKYSLCVIGLELLSWLAFNNPMINSVACITLLLVMFGISLYRLEYGVYAVLGELVIGSQGGALLSLPLGSFTLSLRLGLFLVVMLAWLVQVIRLRKIEFFRSKFWRWYVVLVGCIAVGVLIGVLNGNSLKNVFFDWNGYLFFGMILPFTQAIRTRDHIKTIFVVLAACLSMLTFKTLILLFLYSHTAAFQYFLPDIYRWIRDDRLAEITRQDSGFFRIFFQSFIFAVYGLCISLALVIKRYHWRWLFSLSVVVLLILLSYSRSFWVAIVAAVGCFVVYILWQKVITWCRFFKLIPLFIGIIFGTYILLIAIINVPIPGASGAGVDLNFIGERTQDPNQDAAGGSRIALLRPLLNKNLEHPILGSGFGTTVSYQSLDKRAQESSTNGWYTTYAFEWGYLDLWLKLGLIGLITYILFLGKIFKTGHTLLKQSSSLTKQAIILGGMFSIVALGIIHILTPYLNHPLGIGWILFITCLYDVYETHR